MNKPYFEVIYYQIAKPTIEKFSSRSDAIKFAKEQTLKGYSVTSIRKIQYIGYIDEFNKLITD